MGGKRILLVIALLVVPGLAWAQAKEQAATPPAPTPQESVSMTQEGNVTLEFRDADIKTILKILSFKSGVNIVTGPEVTGIVSISLKDVPWQQALDVILQTYGYAYEKRGNIIVVTTVENLKKRREDAMLLAEQEPLETRTFVLNFGKASEIMTSLQKMKSERGSINFDERTNTIIVNDTPKKLELMDHVVQKLDATTPQVLIEAKIVETTFSDTENLGIDWILKATVSGTARPTIFPFTTHTDSRYAPDDIPAKTTGFTYGTLDFAELEAVFEALKQKTDTNILSNPRIVTLDNRKASITVGSQYPIPNYTYNEDQAKLQVSGWSYKDIGIIFDVTPHVNSAGYVTLDIEPKITAIIGQVVVENTTLPQLSNESATTSVLIKDNETLVIAGLIKETSTDTVNKVPFVGDIPILGYAFRKTEKTKEKTDIILFITPHIITPEIPSDV